MLAVLGMAVSLAVRPRRLFVGRVGGRPVTERRGRATVSVAGLDRVDGRGGLADEVAALAAACGLRSYAGGTTDDEEEQ